MARLTRLGSRNGAISEWKRSRSPLVMPDRGQNGLSEGVIRSARLRRKRRLSPLACQQSIQRATMHAERAGSGRLVSVEPPNHLADQVLLHEIVIAGQRNRDA